MNDDDANQLDELRVDYRRLAERNWNAIQDVHDAYARFGRRTRRLLALLFIVQILTGVGVVIAIENTLSETSARISAIQAQRRQSVFEVCVSQNERHDNTISSLDEELRLASAHVSPARRAELKSSRAFTVALIDALAPKLDCKATAKAATTTHPRRQHQ